MPETTSRIENLLGPELLGALDRLDVLSRKMFAGKLPGERRSKRRGQGVEFDDFRPYVAGDDLRHIDWNVYARSEKFFLKLFREEEDLSVHVVVDASVSMDVGEPSKRLFATRLAMALGYVSLVNHNRVLASVFGGQWEDFDGPIRTLAPIRGRRNAQRLADFLVGSLNQDARESTRPPPEFNDVCRRLARSRAGKGVLVLVSDFLYREGYLPGLNYLAGNVGAGGFDAYCIQVLTPDERDPGRDGGTLVGDLRLLDAETANAAEVTISGALIKRYRERLSQFVGGLESACRAREIQYLLVTSDQDLEEIVLGSLRRGGLVG